MKTKYWLLIVFLILVITTLILYKNYKENAVVGYNLEELKIDKSELKECCEYYENGELKTCSILKRFDCNLCEPRCSS